MVRIELRDAGDEYGAGGRGDALRQKGLHARQADPACGGRADTGDFSWGKNMSSEGDVQGIDAMQKINADLLSQMASARGLLTAPEDDDSVSFAGGVT